MSAKAAAKPVRVMIFGEEYQIRTDLGEDYTRACAKYVDDAIQEAHVGGHIVEPHRAAILAALKITDELFKTRREANGLSDAVQNRVEELAAQLESVAAPVTAPAAAPAANGKAGELPLDD